MNFILRAHHLLCIQGFRGKGYSEEFVANMTKVIDHLNKDQIAKVHLIDSPDHICLGCPNNIGVDKLREFSFNKEYGHRGFCEKENHIVSLDRSVLKTLKLQANIGYSYSDLLEKIRRNLTEESFEHLCGECQWYDLGYCKESLLTKV